MTEYKKEPIIGYEEYQVDTNGVVYNKNGSVKKYSVNPKGYRIVTFVTNRVRKSFQVHRLVAIQFLPNAENLPIVNHKDGDTQNNCVDNLEWCTPEYNMWHSFHVLNREIKNKKKIVGIDKNTGEIVYEFDSLADAGRYFANGKNYRYYQNSICKVASKEGRTYKKCYWKYVE